MPRHDGSATTIALSGSYFKGGRTAVNAHVPETESLAVRSIISGPKQKKAITKEH